MELRANLFNDFIHAIRPQEPVYAMDLLADMDDAEDVDHTDDIKLVLSVNYTLIIIKNYFIV